MLMLTLGRMQRVQVMWMDFLMNMQVSIVFHSINHGKIIVPVKRVDIYVLLLVSPITASSFRESSLSFFLTLDLLILFLLLQILYIQGVSFGNTKVN